MFQRLCREGGKEGDILKLHIDTLEEDSSSSEEEVEVPQGWKFMSCSHCQELCQQASSPS